MGCFSWFTQDTNKRIVIGEPATIIMSDDKGNHYVENCYEGYGEFGGKDYYELLAEMNGLGSNRSKGIELAFNGSPEGVNPNCKHPSLTQNGVYMNGVAPVSDPNQGFSIESDWEYISE